MNSTGNETFDRIQQEIQEVLDREEELRNKYQSVQVHTNGHVSPSSEPRPVPEYPATNGTHKTASQHINGARLFTPNPSSKGVMHKFFKARGKLHMVTTKTTSNAQPAWAPDDYLIPAKITVEPGKPIRNGFVPAEEKMRRELQEFTRREEELRTERRKSQPNLMALLEREAKVDSNLKSTRSLSGTYSSEDLTDSASAPPSLKRARSLAALCDTSDDELDVPGTLSLISKFEKLQNRS